MGKKKINNGNIIDCPNSIYHGMELNSTTGRLPLILRMEVEQLRDFIEFLFDHSEHCDHISHADAWKEFKIYEAKTSMMADRVREHRRKLK